jgi:transposase
MTWRPKKLTATQREERRLEAGQLLRTTDLSQAAIARIVGVSRTAVTKWKQQRRLGWSPQQPAVYAKERDEELIAAWLRQDWPRIKKSAAARRNHHSGR